MAEQKPRNRYEQIKAALKNVDLNPFDDFGSPQERAFNKMMKRDPERAAKVFPDLFKEYAQKKADGGSVGKDTGKTTQEGRTVFETKDGEMVSEKSVTFKYKGKWVNVPSIHEGRSYDQDTLKLMLDRGLIKPTSQHENLENAKKAAAKRSEALEFNNGGTVMKETGGLYDEGGTVDEESGNEVPVGSTKKEVRDDIPAMLSEGEFVLPADVVRYHGLEKIMQLRDEAKFGLQKMEAMGQMGNADEATLPDDVPFGMDDLLIVVGPEAEEGKSEKGKKDDGPIEANVGAFIQPTMNPAGQVPPANSGIVGYQPSMYGYQQPTAGSPTPTIGLQPTQQQQPYIPASSIVPTQQLQTVGGYSPLYAAQPVPQVAPHLVDFDKFVPDPLNEDDDVTDTGTGDTGTEDVTDTEVDTTQVTQQQQQDDNGQEKKRLEKMVADRERVQSQERAAKLDPDSLAFKNTSDQELIDIYTKAKEAQGVAMGVGLLSGPVGLLAGVAARNELGKAKKALQARFGDKWEDQVKDITIGSAVKDGLGQIKDDFTKSIEQTFTAEGRKTFYDNYEAKYDVSAMGSIAGGGQSYTGKNDDGTYGGNLSVREQQAFDNAVNSGDTSVANHYASIARLRDKQDKFAESGFDEALGMSMGLSSHDMEQAKLYGGSIDTALKQGRAEKTGFLKPIVVTDSSKSDSGTIAANSTKVSTGAGGTNTNTTGGQSGGSSNKDTNIASSGRSETQIQADINKALKEAKASGKSWTPELNTLVAERDSARNNDGGGSSNNDGGGSGSTPDNGATSGCCFIMLEARYGNGTMDEVVRRYRDEHMTDRNRRGYYKVAEVLVPLMRASPTIKWLVTKTFADPLVSYGKYYYGQNKHGVIYSPIKNLWMKIFDIVGGDTEFIRENGETV